MLTNRLPLSQGQRALWFLQRLRPEAAAWNIAAAARVRGQLDSSRLQRAFERLTERHDALRLSFHETPDGPVQCLRQGDALDFREEDAAAWEEARLQGYLQSEADQPFDLEGDPLLRVRLLRTGANDVLLLVIHHLVADLGSLAVLVRELGLLYEGTLSAPPPLPYSEFIARQRERLEGRAAERHWAYWSERLAGELPVCELPSDRPRPAVRTFRGGSRTRRMGLELPTSRAFPFLVAGLDVLLHRASGQTDLLVGSPTSGRLGHDLDDTVGYLVNPVVLRSDLSGSPTFGQLLERVRGVAMGALRHQDYPFPLLVERLQPQRDLARPPVFQVMLAFQRAHLPGTGDLAAFALGIEGAEVRTGSMVLESLALERRFSQLDLELMAAETSRGIELALTFNTDLFEPATAERLLGHLATLLGAAAEDPDRSIGELPLLSTAEQRQLLEWNRTAAPLPDRRVHELFEEQAERTPAAIAVSAPDGVLTYAELRGRSDEMARALLERGLAPEEPVAVWAERGASLLVALLGVLKAGGVYLPLNPNYPEPRLARMVALSGARLQIREGEIAGSGRGGRKGRGSDQSLAYLLFTSGSTGDPKGVLIPHRGLLNHLLSKVRDLGLTPDDRVAQTASPSFDISLWQLLAPLLVGATVEILPDDVIRDPNLLVAEVERRKITVLELVPSVLSLLPGRPNLRWLISTGEALPPELARRWVPLINGYGPTECADRVSHAFLRAVPEDAVHTSIGRPIPNLRLHVLSPDLEPQPVGFPGEICIAGAGLGRGYLDDPARTAAAFVPDPFEAGGRLYRTGDLGRRRADGEIEVLGRLDHQIKLRGVRIEPGEIEAALATHPGVREAVVGLREGRLVAWWTGERDAEMRDHLRERLPDAMVPTVFQHLDALPLTPHGKVDRRALPTPAEPERAEVPGDDLERLLAGILGEVLGRERIGLREDFFDLGGHSLLAAQAAARVRNALGIEAPVSLLFEEPTVAGLARRVQGISGVFSPLRRAPRDGRIPLTTPQQRLWFLHRLDPDSPAYNMPGLARVSGDPASLRASLSAVVARHEALRTTFPGEEPWQEIAPPAPVELPVVDLSGLPDPAGEARRLASEEARRPFDLARGPLIRTFLLSLRANREENRLLVNLHHIVADGWSLEILAREVSALLRGEALPELPVQYADYAVWQREQPARPDWWMREMAGDLSPLELPLDRPRPPRQRHRGASVPIHIPGRLARCAGATPFMVLLAAFQTLLHRLSGQDDIRVGAPVANRGRVEIEGLIGLFANTLVLRTRFGGALRFLELIGSVRKTALGAYLHQDVPFGRLVDELQPERDPSRTPLFQAMLALQPPGESPFAVEEIGTGTAKLELTLSLRELDDRIEGWIEHDTDLFDGTTVLRWSRSLLMLLEGLDDPRPVSELPLLGPEERSQLLREWNDTRSPVPETCVHRLFEAQAERTPDAIALSCEGADFTYRELDIRANRLAHRLRRLGVGPEVAVGLVGDRSIEMVVNLLGILKSGGSYVPLDSSYPRERLDWMIEDSGALLLLPQDTDGEPEHAPDVPVLPESLAYTIFTSGSTGRPKGVQVPHAALANFLAAMPLRPDDVLLAVTTLSFDIAALEILLPLTRGARVVMASRETAADGALLAAEIERSGATVLQATPATWRMLIESGWPGSPDLTALCGGEALPRELARSLLDRTAVLWNLYGPTETTVWSAVHRVEDADRAIPVGRPIANTSIHLVDREMQPVPVGVTGELLIGGAGVARGYRGRPDLTAERFLPGKSGAPLYRTGDLARRLPDGKLEILGRLDQQVKVRGFRIEMEEVEAALESHPAVVRAVADVRDGRLVAYVVGDPTELRAWLARRLPEFMIPSLFTAVDALPLTPNGKVDRRALPYPGPAPDAGESPKGPVETALAEIWAQVLGIESVGRHRGFFELGGHSLLATRVMARANEAFGTGLPLRALFEAPTVAGLARLVTSARKEHLPAFRRVPRDGPLAPSFAQERLWVMDQMIPDSPVYNVFQALDLSGPLDEAALERAFGEVVRRHETLRTRFTTVQGRPMQVVEPYRPRPLPVVDLRGLAPIPRQEEADRLAREEARRPFDLRQGPLVRFALLRLGGLGGASRLLLNLHHIVCDGWSLDLLAREVGALYRGQTLPEPDFQYADYADWQRRWPAEVLDSQLSWWRDRLAGLAVLEMPTDRPRPSVQSFRGGQVSAPLPTLARDGRTTPFLLLMTAWQVLLHRLTGQADVAVGTPVANRNRPEVEDLIGFFVNNLVLRADLSRTPTFAEALDRVREAVLSASSYQDLPFERLAAELAPERGLSRSPLFQVAFSYQAAIPLGLDAELVDVHTGTAKLDLWLQVDQEGEGWRARAEYASDLFDAATVRRWLGHLRVLLEGIAVSPGADRISELPLLSQAERHQLLEWNGTGRGRRTTVLQLVEEQAARTPDAMAVVSGDERITYAELDAQAEALADRLGIGPEDCVAVMMERSAALIVALLATFKAGAVYAPLDPELPAERLAFLLEDLRPAVVLPRAVLSRDTAPGLPPAGPRPAVLPDSLAYVLHTSGSTGSPKPVGVTHAALAEHILAWADLLELGERDRALFFASPAFDVSLEQLLSALVRGATVVLRGPEIWPPAEFSRIAEGLGLTVAELPTAYWRQWVREDASGAPPALRLVTAGGEAMPVEEARLWLRSPLAGSRLLNAYGPTEAVVTATTLEVDAASVSRPGTVALGRPLPGRRACVADIHGQLQPVGAAGELCLGGPLARGYLGRPDLTAERFVPDPGSPEPGGRLYRTGDLARWLPDGTLQFLGRIDQQVKIRGFRIELKEIETVLMGCPGLREAAVLAREDRPNVRRLVAYFVPEPGREPSSDQLRGWLRRKLPEAMVPAAFVPLDALPLTPGGKVDPRALPAPVEPALAAETPRTPLEVLVAGVFAEVLGVAEVPLNARFFDLGGNSLMATQVVTLLQEVLPVEIDLRKVFEGPTVARMAEILDEECNALPEPEQIAIAEILAELA
ncbi:MAG TPA: amino acid adenylation domain-containing protein [Thermoanaerobaculia bacterium]|nr:amino acid adenylation domain-containing protein [Thermoanaerobaculia bacterium]